MAGADLGAHIEPESFNAVMGYDVPRPTSWNVGLKGETSRGQTTAPLKLRRVRALSRLIEELACLHLAIPSVFQKFAFDNREIDWRILFPGLVSSEVVMGVSEAHASL